MEGGGGEGVGGIRIKVGHFQRRGGGNLDNTVDTTARIVCSLDTCSMSPEIGIIQVSCVYVCVCTSCDTFWFSFFT